MITLTHALHATLRANARAGRICEERGERFDPLSVLKLFNPLGAATWIATELDDDGDTLLGLADLGFGCPELCSFSLGEIAGVRLRFGLTIERDIAFTPRAPLSVWAETARRLGSILHAEQALRRAVPPGNILPSRDG